MSDETKDAPAPAAPDVVIAASAPVVATAHPLIDVSVQPDRIEYTIETSDIDVASRAAGRILAALISDPLGPVPTHPPEIVLRDDHAVVAIRVRT